MAFSHTYRATAVEVFDRVIAVYVDSYIQAIFELLVFCIVPVL